MIATRLFKLTYIKSKLLILPKFRNYIAIKEVIGEATSTRKIFSNTNRLILAYVTVKLFAGSY